MESSGVENCILPACEKSLTPVRPPPSVQNITIIKSSFIVGNLYFQSDTDDGLPVKM